MPEGQFEECWLRGPAANNIECRNRAEFRYLPRKTDRSSLAKSASFHVQNSDTAHRPLRPPVTGG